MSCAPVQICIFHVLFILNMNVFTICNLGPATLRMTSENGPDFSLPLHLPPGHVVQQILDENGVLTHVIMSQTGPPPPPPPPHPHPHHPHHHHVVIIIIDQIL